MTGEKEAALPEQQRWPGGRLYFMAPFHSTGKEFEIAVETPLQGPDEGFLFALPEYDRAFTNVLQEAIEELTRQKSTVLRSITDTRDNVVRTTHVTAPSGEVVSTPPLQVAMRYAYTAYEVTDFDLAALARSCDQAAEQLTDAKLDHLLDFHGRVTEAFGNVSDAGGGKFGWQVLLPALERMPIDFSPTGEPLLPKIIAENDKRHFVDYPPMCDEERKAFDDLINRKRKESHA